MPTDPHVAKEDRLPAYSCFPPQGGEVDEIESLETKVCKCAACSYPTKAPTALQVSTHREGKMDLPKRIVKIKPSTPVF